MINSDPDDLSYLQFVTPNRRDKALRTLEGILSGIWLDGRVNEDEVSELQEWISDNKRLMSSVPFSEIIPKLVRAVDEGRFNDEEMKEILWVIGNSKTDSGYYDEITGQIQELHGLLHGITADRVIEESELEGLRAWMREREHLKGHYPFDEIESLLIDALRDGRIDAEEHAALLSFFADFVSYSLSKRIDDAFRVARGELPPALNVSGLCATDPQITFEGKVIAFTGISDRASRKEIGELIALSLGVLSDNVSEADYLVVGSGGNPAWAFACYGRKVEMAMNLRKSGRAIVIVAESDFWDAITP
jgi:hypothetical protein